MLFPLMAFELEFGRENPGRKEPENPRSLVGESELIGGGKTEAASVG